MLENLSGQHIYSAESLTNLSVLNLWRELSPAVSWLSPPTRTETRRVSSPDLQGTELTAAQSMRSGSCTPRSGQAQLKDAQHFLQNQALRKRTNVFKYLRNVKPKQYSSKRRNIRKISIKYDRSYFQHTKIIQIHNVNDSKNKNEQRM